MKQLLFSKIMLNIQHSIQDHPHFTSMVALLTLIFNFALKSFVIDIMLFFVLIFLIVLDSIVGIRLAKKTGDFSYKILKEKTMTKFLGYLIFLIALWLFTLMLFITNLRDGKFYIAEYWLNIPMVITFAFFGGIEFLSIKEKVEKGYGVRTPNKFANKVKDFIENENIEDFKKPE